MPTSTSTPTFTPTPIPVGENRNNPVPFGQSQITDDGFSLWVVEVTDDATDSVLAENQFNDPPPEGYQFLMVRIKVKNNIPGSQRFESHRLSVVGKSAIEFSKGCGVIPDRFDDYREIFEGGEAEGNVCFTVKSLDAAEPMVIYYDERGETRLFWSLSEESETSESIQQRQVSVSVVPTPAALGENRNNPVPFGQSQITDDGFSLWVVEVTDDATDSVLTENQFNDPPSEGYQFLMVRIKVKNNIPGSQRFESHSLSVVGKSAIEFSEGCGVIPDRFDDYREIFEGGEAEGNVCFTIKSLDAAEPMVIYYDERGETRLFWSLEQ